MDFKLSEEQQAIKEMARNFAEREIVPVADGYDRNHVFPRDLVKKMGELGFFGTLIPEEYGGTNMGFMAMCLMTEEVSRASSSIRGAINMQCVGTAYNILKNGNEEQKRKYIPSLVAGEKMGCFAMTEADSGSDVLSMKSKAAAQGDGFLLNGSKTWISYAPVADVAIVYAFTQPEARSKGLSAFVVEMDQAGITVKDIDKIGSHSFPSGEIIFEDVRLPAGSILGKPGDGARILFSSLPDTRLGCAAGAVGLAQACLGKSIAYCQTRAQFGAPISNFQMNQAIIAEMATLIEASRLLVYRAATQKDEGFKGNVLETSYAKYYSANAVVQVANWAMEIFGAYGYSAEYPIGRFLRDAKLYQIVEGTSNIHRMIIGMDQLGLRKANISK
jgi:glutaryl-CoA dehydrogenase (non-decarboxylating)